MATGSLTVTAVWPEGLRFLLTRAPLLARTLAAPAGLYLVLLLSRHRFELGDWGFAAWSEAYRLLETGAARLATDLLLGYLLVRMVTALYEIAVAGEARSGLASLRWGANEFRLLGTGFATVLMLATYVASAVILVTLVLVIFGVVWGLAPEADMLDYWFFWAAPLLEEGTTAQVALVIEAIAAALFALGLIRLLMGLSLLFPVAIEERRITLTGAWSLGRDVPIRLLLAHLFGLLAVLLGLAAPAGVVCITLAVWLSGIGIAEFLIQFSQTELLLPPQFIAPTLLLHGFGLVLIIAVAGGFAGLAGALYRVRMEQV